MSNIQITIENGYYAMRSPRDQVLIDNLKAMIRPNLRRWDGEARAWIVDPRAIELLVKACERSGYETPSYEPITSTAIQAPIQKTLTVEYIGLCKQRDDGAITALGSVKGYWSVEFPESVLKDWFERAPKQETGQQTYYQRLCVFETASGQEIKSAYRRLSRQWHPDICAEPDAKEKFQDLNEAYDIIGDPIKRKRYDAGLFFQREALKAPEPDFDSSYGHFFMNRYTGRYQKSHQIQHFRAPLRCGLITADGIQKLNRFSVSKIIQWDDITDAGGRVMTASWNKITESIEINWI